MATDIAVLSQTVSNPRQRLQQIVDEYTANAKKALEIRLAANELHPLNFDILRISVKDDATAELAADGARQAEEYKQEVAQVFEAPTAFFFKVHRWLTGARGELTKPADDVIAHNKQQTAAYLRHREQERRELEAKLQREAAEHAKAEAERIRKEQAEQKAKEELWDFLAPEPEPVVVAVPQVVVPHTPAPAGIKEKRKPWTFQVYDLVAFMKAAIADPTLLEYIDADNFLNKKMMKAKAQQMGADLEKRFPGVRGVRETRVEF